MLAINPELVDLERANAEFPPFPDTRGEHGRGPHGVLLHLARLGLLGDQVGYLGRRASRAPKSASGISKSAPRDLAVLENIETDVQGDAAALREGDVSSQP